jgi:hypothetical protein
MLSHNIYEVLLLMTSIYGANKRNSWPYLLKTNQHHSTRKEIMYINIGHLVMKESVQRVHLKSAGER